MESELTKIILKNLNDDGARFYLNGRRVKYNVRHNFFAYCNTFDSTTPDLDNAVITKYPSKTDPDDNSIRFTLEKRDYILEILMPVQFNV